MAPRFHRLLALTGLLALADPSAAGEIYTFTYRATLSIAGTEISGGFRVEGALEIEQAAFALSQLTCTDAVGGAPGPQMRAACDEIAGTVGWAFLDDGALASVRLPSGISAGGGTLLSGLAAMVPFIVRESSDWTTIEPDTVGLARAHYRRNGSTISRRKDQYLMIASNGALRAVRPGEAGLVSHSEARLDEGRIVFQQTDETISRQASGSNIPDAEARSHMTMTWREHRPEHLSPTAGASQRLFDPPTEDARRHAAAMAILGGRDLADLRATLADGTLNDTKKRQALIALRSLLSIDHKAAEDLAATCTSGGEQTCAIYIHALGQAGTDAAQTALRRLFHDLAGDGTLGAAKLRREVVRALGTRLAGRMTPATRTFLVDHIDDTLVGTQAAYGLGAEAYRRRGTLDGHRALAPLLSRWSGDRVRWFNALGNAGAPEAVDEIAAAIANGDPAAVAAIRALRRMPQTGAVDAAFLAALSAKRTGLRRAALDSLASRSLRGDLMDRIAEIAVGDTQEASMARELLRDAAKAK
ncbi:HEAT repeat domain-containing protein [Roseovarius sp. M141]|uniref:HEAT repeat domain-containing protein n=1 Tax=Roseovarius sp. M141 TaxID=2583806 RepID=UPI0020CF825E|nr:hypothetical protein [Roseovarius sp. M141]MCQ0091089.1 hypothetical protein [Roseovarius sp. M141]